MHRRLRSAILTLVVAGAGAIPAAGESEAPTAAPKLEAAQTMAALGEVMRGDSPGHDFVLRNSGGAELRLAVGYLEGGVLVRHLDAVIPPGAQGKLRLELDTSRLAGDVRPRVVLQTNDPAQLSATFTLEAVVKSSLVVKPGYARYLYVQHESVGRIAQTLWAGDTEDFQITAAQSPYPYLGVTFREAAPEERRPEGVGKQWRVEATLAADSPVGALTGVITVTTNHPREKQVFIPVSGFVRPILAVTPPVGEFKPVSLAKPLDLSFFVRNFATEPIALSVTANPSPGISARLEPLEAGRRYNLIVTLAPELPKGLLDTQITLRSDSPKVPELTVPLRGTIL